MSDSKTNNKEPQYKDLQEMVEVIAKKINGSPVLNGGFDRLMVTVDHIRERQLEANSKLGKIYEDLYEPDDGLYARVKMVENITADFSKKFQEHTTTDEKLQTVLNDSLAKLDGDLAHKLDTTKRLQKIAGEDLDKLESILKVKNMWLNIWSKAAWLLGGGILAAIGKTAWELIVHR